MIATRATSILEEAEVLDRAVDVARGRVDALVRDPRRARALQGSWLGHPLHPVLTDVPIGCWTSAWLIDVFGGDGHDDLATWFVGLGVLSAVPTALTGWASWARLSPEMQRVGVVHAAANSVAIGLYAASWRARRRGDRWRGVRLAHAGAIVASGAAFLGGHLAFGTDVGPAAGTCPGARRRVRPSRRG